MKINTLISNLIKKSFIALRNNTSIYIQINKIQCFALSLTLLSPHLSLSLPFSLSPSLSLSLSLSLSIYLNETP